MEFSENNLLPLPKGSEGAGTNVSKVVKTDITERLNPAVVHERVQPVRHEKLGEHITREIHTHHVYHRVLPVIETETLPPKHFIDDGHALHEVSEEEARLHTVTGTRGFWQPLEQDQPAPTPLASSSSGSNGQSSHRMHSPAVSEQQRRALQRQTPILTDRKTYTTEEGMLRTEYLWRHPPVFDDAHGRTQPVRVSAGLSPEWKAAVDNETY